MNIVDAKPAAIDGFRQVFGRDPSPAELELVLAQGNHEGGYGDAWKGPGKGSNNWGAVQAGRVPADGVIPPDTFVYEDSHPTDGGGQVKYKILFKRYATPADGAADMIRHAGQSSYVALKDNPSVAGFALALYRRGYYEGFNATPEQALAWKPVIDALMTLDPSLGPIKAGRVAGYADALYRNAAQVARALGRPQELPLIPRLVDESGKPMPRPFIPSPDQVRKVQVALTPLATKPDAPTVDLLGKPMTGAAKWTAAKDQDGKYGPRTGALVKYWQATNKARVVDGVLDAWTYQKITGDKLPEGTTMTASVGAEGTPSARAAATGDMKRDTPHSFIAEEWHHARAAAGSLFHWATATPTRQAGTAVTLAGLGYGFYRLVRAAMGKG